MSVHTPSVPFVERTVGEIVAEDFRLGAVFKQYGIDFCCGGGRTVGDACARKGVDPAELEAALARPARTALPAPSDPRTWDLPFLADYIVQVHHRYVRETLPVLQAFTTKVARVHGAARPELVEIATLVDELAGEMTAHLAKEEQVLFPYVHQLAAVREGRAESAAPAFGTARNPIAAMEHEHDHAGDLVRRLRALSDDYTPPEWACNTYRAAYAKLEEFEEDLHLHVHLENNVLFPGVLNLETQVAQA